MKGATLLDLADTWERDSIPPQKLLDAVEDGYDDAKERYERGARQAKKECAQTLRLLVGMMGEG